MNKTLLVVVGPTAIGKTTLAIALAKHFKTEILSADSRQFYKEMKIGTAVPSLEELQAIKHHFIQHKSVLEQYSVGDFEKDALTLLSRLFEQKNIVVLVGGSGLYVDAVVKGLDTFPKVNAEIRTQLNQTLQTQGISKLQDQLKRLDRRYYERVDLENPHRLIRALEVCIGSGQPYSSFIGQEKSKRPFETITIGINADRQVIYDRINARVDMMITDGLLDEVKSVYTYKDRNALQTVGYKELFEYLESRTDLDVAISEIKKNTRRFAKRQLTWFRKNKNIHWIDYDQNFEHVIRIIEHHLK